MVTPVFEVRHLEKRLPNGVVLTDLNLSLAAGDFLGIVGPTGVGKSLLLQVLATLMPLDGGEIWIDGVPSTHLERARRNLGYFGGVPEQFPEMTVREFLSFFGRGHGVDEAYVPVRVEELLSATGLTQHGDDNMAALTRTALRRAGLARALVHSPRVLLLDDPLRKLAGSELSRWVGVLEKVRGEGLCVVFAAETVREVRHLLTHACVLAAGRVLGCGPIDTLDSRVSQLRSIHLQVAGAVRATNLLHSWPGVFQATSSGDIIKVLFMGDTNEVLGMVRFLSTEGVSVVSFRQEPAYLM